MVNRNMYADVLADLRRKREAIDQAIRSLEFLVGDDVAAHDIANAIYNAPYDRNNHVPSVGGPAPKASSGRFADMSIRLAAIQVLAESPTPLSTREISRRLTDGGFEHNSQNFPNTVRTTLAREGEFIQTQNGWALDPAFEKGLLRDVG
jgi:hypothetical protein